jgi:hypothetical protein
MKKTLVFLILLLSFINLNAQTSKEEPNITAIKLESDKIILNDQLAYRYNRNNNDFTITDLTGKELIKGSITSHGNGKFSSVLTFGAFGKEFSNAKIIGRKEIIFALCDNNVISKDFKIDEEKLGLFFAKYNELK